MWILLLYWFMVPSMHTERPWSSPLNLSLSQSSNGIVQWLSSPLGVFVMRDPYGRILWEPRRRILPSSVPFAELSATWEGNKCAIFQFQASQIWMEGDSPTVISWFNAGHACQAQANINLKNIPLWKRTLFAFKAIHIHHEGNRSSV